MEAKPEEDRGIHVNDIAEVARKNGTGVTELRNIAGVKRDWKRWIEAVPTLRGVRKGERRISIIVT